MRRERKKERKKESESEQSLQINTRSVHFGPKVSSEVDLQESLPIVAFQTLGLASWRHDRILALALRACLHSTLARMRHLHCTACQAPSCSATKSVSGRFASPLSLSPD